MPMPIQKLPYFGIVKLRDLPFAFYNCDSQPYIGSITDHPYYRSLDENDPSIFLTYYKSREHSLNFIEYSWENFVALKEKIRLDGWHPNLGPPITVRDAGQEDGTHRLCILCYLYGPDATVMIVDGNLTFPALQLNEYQIERLSHAIGRLVLKKTAQISALENELANCKNEKRALLNSNSWKLTKPLRFIKDWFLSKT